jgi:aminoglycoside phosphotransferase (APT) family kinase protein
VQVLSVPCVGQVVLVHGDYCPANLLLDDARCVTGLLDFGLFTMAGDHLFDVATACAFFDMYDELGRDLCNRLLTRAAELYGAHSRGRLHRYILVYSIVAANTYAADCSDGHYAWCVANLNRDEYWQDLT